MPFDEKLAWVAVTVFVMVIIFVLTLRLGTLERQCLWVLDESVDVVRCIEAVREVK